MHRFLTTLFLLQALSGCSLIFDPTQGEQPPLESDASENVVDANENIEDANENVVDANGGVFVLDSILNLSSGTLDSLTPTTVWDGTNFRVVWEQNQQPANTTKNVVAATIDEMISPILLTTTVVNRSTPTAAWTGTQLAVAWLDKPNGQFDLPKHVHFGLLGTDNVFQQAPILPSSALNGNAEHPFLLTTGTQIGLLWTQRQSAAPIFLTRTDNQGAFIVDGRSQVDDGLTPSAAFDGFFYGVVATDVNGQQISQVFFRSASAVGVLNGTRQPLSDPQFGTLAPAIASGGDGFAVVWQQVDAQGNTNAVFMRLLSADLSPGPQLRLTSENVSASAPSIVWNGDGYGVAWHERTSPEPQQIMFQEFDAQGVPRGAKVKLSVGNENSIRVSLAHNGSGYAASWEQGATSPRTIQFRSFSLQQ